MYLEKARPPKPPAKMYIKVLLVGPSKTGKTTSLMSLATPILVVDTDLRSESIIGFPDVDVYQIFPNPTSLTKGWNEAVTIGDELWEQVRLNKLKYKTIIFDGLSSLRRLCMQHCLTLTGTGAQKLSTSPGGGPSQAHYGPHIHLTEKFINKVLPLPANIAFTGHFYNFEDKDTNKMEWFPSVFGSGLRNEIGSWFNECYVTKREKGKYYWQTLADRKYTFIGSSLNKLCKYWKDPIEIDFDSPPVGFADLLNRRAEKEKEDVKSNNSKHSS